MQLTTILNICTPWAYARSTQILSLALALQELSSWIALMFMKLHHESHLSAGLIHNPSSSAAGPKPIAKEPAGPRKRCPTPRPLQGSGRAAARSLQQPAG